MDLHKFEALDRYLTEDEIKTVMLQLCEVCALPGSIQPLRACNGQVLASARCTKLVQLSIQEQPLHRTVVWYRGGLVFEAHRRLYHSA